MKGIQVDFFLKQEDGSEKNVLSTWLQQIPREGSTIHLRSARDFDTHFKQSFKVEAVHHVIVNHIHTSPHEFEVQERVEIYVSELSE